MFHLSDSYFFFNELTKAQATSENESDVSHAYRQNKKYYDRSCGRLVTTCFMIPYFLTAISFRGMAWKLGLFYCLYSVIDAIYDAGIYLNFIVRGPKFLRKVLELDEKDSFSPH